MNFDKDNTDGGGQKEDPALLNPRLFNSILLKIQRIIKYSYIEDFYKHKYTELI
jgi:hypothetical protein